MTDRETILVNTTSFSCIFCGQMITKGDDRETGEPVLLHRQPTCNKFDTLDMYEFVHESYKQAEVNQAKKVQS